MTKRELNRQKASITKFIKTCTDAEFDGLVAEANKVGFRELSRKLLIVWVSGAKQSSEKP